MTAIFYVFLLFSLSFLVALCLPTCHSWTTMHLYDVFSLLIFFIILATLSLRSFAVIVLFFYFTFRAVALVAICHTGRR